MNMIEKGPAEANEATLRAEQEVLGSLLICPDALEVVRPIIDAAMFHGDDHRRIYRHIAALAHGGEPIDIVTLADAIQRSNELDQVGGYEYLATLYQASASAANIVAHAKIVRNGSAERQAVQAAINFAQGHGPLADRASALAAHMEVCSRSVADRGLPRPRKFSELMHAKPIRFDYALPGLRVGNVGVFAGYGGIGKGFLGLALAMDTAIGKGVLTGLQMGAPGKVLFLSIEDDQEALDARQQSFAQYLSRAEIDLLDANLQVISVYGMPAWQLLQRGERGALTENTAAISSIIKAAEGARLVILDTARKFFAFDENKSDEAAAALYVCDQIARKSKAAVILVHHLSKPSVGDEMPSIFDIRGSSALVADARWAAILCAPTGKFATDKGLPTEARSRYRVLDVGKVNHGGKPEMTLFRQDANGVLVTEEWPQAPGQGGAVMTNGVTTTMSFAEHKLKRHQP